MPRDLDLDFEFQDEDLRERHPRPSRPAPRREGAGRSGGRGGAPVRRRKNDMTSIIILAVEIVVFAALIVLFFVLKGKIVDSDSKASAAASESAQGNNGTNVENDDFSLTCTKVKLDMDSNNNPMAIVYFTFVNKTDTPLSMNEVFPPSIKQNGQDCPEDVDMPEIPTEVTNKDMQVSGGQSVECAYAFQIFDTTNPLTLTIRDNYSTFQDIGSQEIGIS